jgi:outer membrane protein assembly factor BamB
MVSLFSINRRIEGELNLIKRNLLKNCFVLVFITSLLIPFAIGQNTDFVNSLQIKTTSINTNKLESSSGLLNSSWPMFHHDVRHTGRSPYGPVGNSPSIKWKFRMEGLTVSSPALDENGTIYIGAEDFHKSFFAINSDGTEKWGFDAGHWVDSSPAIAADGTVYFGSNNHYLQAIWPNGTLKWRFDMSDWVFSSPTIGADGTIYVGSFDHYFYAINPNGTQQWRFNTGFYVFSSAVIDDNGIIYFGSHDMYLYALYPNGTLAWRYKTNNRIKGSPSIGNDGTIYICSWDNYLYAIAPNGTLKWKFGTGSSTETSPAIASDGTIYVGSYNGLLFSVTPNGTQNWCFQTGNGIYSSPAIDKNGITYCGSYDGNLYALNPDGTLRWKFDAGDNMESSPVIGEDGTIYIAAQFEPSGGNSSYTYLYALKLINNSSPSTPSIQGPASGTIKQNYDYTIVSTDPEDNNISYYVNWGDGTTTGWIGPYGSGQEQTVSHTWEKKGTYTIQVKARDNYSAESDWGTLQVTMPLSYEPPQFPFIHWLLERFPNAFPILRYFFDNYNIH